MNALQSYSSDEDSNVYKKEKSMKGADYGTNYDNVGMDISEDSDEESKEKSQKPTSNIENMRNNSIQSIEISDRLKPVHDKIENESREESRSSSGDSKEESCKRPDKDRDLDKDRSGRDRHDKDRRDHDRDRDRHDHHRRDDRDRRRRSRSRERRHRSRSRSRERRRRSRSRSRSRDRRYSDSRRAAHHKLASMRSHPDIDQAEMLRRSMEEQIVEVEKQTGVKIPTYYNPAIMNPLKLAEQERKKRLLWGNKSKDTEDTQKPVLPIVPQDSMWANTKFSNDSDGKMAEKFKRLMGVKSAGPSTLGGRVIPEDMNKKQESLFNNMEKQYETARMTTHTQRGFGLGFSSSHSSFVPK